MFYCITLACVIHLIPLYHDICEVIKQYESEIDQIQFLFFWLVEHIICKVHFTTDPTEIGWLVQKILEVLEKQWETNKLSALFG